MGPRGNGNIRPNSDQKRVLSEDKSGEEAGYLRRASMRPKGEMKKATWTTNRVYDGKPEPVWG